MTLAAITTKGGGGKNGDSARFSLKGMSHCVLAEKEGEKNYGDTDSGVVAERSMSHCVLSKKNKKLLRHEGWRCR